LDQSEHQLQDGRFSTSVRADHGDRLALFYLEAGVANNVHAWCVGETNILELDDRIFRHNLFSKCLIHRISDLFDGGDGILTQRIEGLHLGTQLLCDGIGALLIELWLDE
jgi:hypothetical protein